MVLSPPLFNRALPTRGKGRALLEPVPSRDYKGADAQVRRDVGIGRRGLLFESRQKRREPTKEPNPSIIVETFPMADINLTQDEADKLMAMGKRAVDKTELLFPVPGDSLAIPLTSLDKRENFMLDVTRAQIKLAKATYQNRARAAIILLRLDLNGPPRRNPDGAEISCPHLHI